MVEMEVSAVEKKSNEENDGSLWERFLPRMVLRVLLVEADDSTRQIIAALLRKCSYIVAAVPDGLMAWETLKDRPHNIDLILTEVELPSISGYALLTLVMEHDICKNIPVIMMSSEDSFSMVLKCMVKGAADFLIKPVRRNELRNLWQHVWRRHMLAGGCAPHNLPASEHKVEATAENNDESNQSSDYESSTQKIKDESDTQGLSQWKCTSSNISYTGREHQGNVVTLGHESLKNEGQAEGLYGNRFVSENSKGSVKEVAYCSDTGESIAPKLEESSAFLEGATHDTVGLQSEGRTGHVTMGVGCNDKLIESSTGAIDLIASFDKHPKGTFVIIDGPNKSEFSPQLELSLRRSCSVSSKNQGTGEKHILNHSDASAFSWYKNRKSLKPVFPTIDGNRAALKENDSKLIRDLEGKDGISERHVVTPSDSWEILPSPVNGQSDRTFSNASLGLFSVAGVRLVTGCSPKQATMQQHSPLPVNTSLHSDPDVNDSEQVNHWSDEATNSTVVQTVQGQDKQVPVEELRCSSPVDDLSSCSHLCNDVSNHEKGFAHGGGMSWSSTSASAATSAAINDSTATDISGGSNRFVHDGLKRMGAPHSSEREAALTNFRLKRKDLCFEKKAWISHFLVEWKRTRGILARRRRPVSGRGRGTKPKQWDLALPQAEFSYNRSKNKTTGLSPFEIVYGQNPSGVLDLAPIPRIGRFSPKADEMAKYLRGIHEQVKQTIHESNTKYKTRVDNHRHQVLFEIGDFVWAVLTRDRFPVGEYNKLKDRKIEPCEVVQKINDNAYRLRLLSHMKTSDVFNVKHLSPCFVDSDDTTLNSRTSSFQPGVTDAGGSETDDAELSDYTLMALRYHELADQRKGGS
ncbi:Two-component response regulator-like APRR9 [Hibiscus syriacus]|uniref:Two-component response regulator-like APRR9 n=1 Tax=Hibiscus syriacus TaxID=106335 RepID=A0A6A2YQQ4_HIBSY|nr:Two-component response regulator-like APRR9 [Hibiscus syriacus]